MKLLERRKARILRSKGFSLKQITRELRIAKSSASIWVRDVKLSNAQIKRLKARHTALDVIERRRKTRLTHEDARREKIIEQAAKRVPDLVKNNLWLLGVALYWGEGRKTQYVGFTNSDPKMIRIIMRFFREACRVPEQKFRGHIHIHPHLDHYAAEKYWSRVSGISLHKFYKTYRIPNKSSKNKRDTLPFGTFDIVICDTFLFLNIRGWIRGIVQQNLGV